jgi:hypothetical protein
MSNDEFESWLSLVGRLLGLSERQRNQISEELRDHLESRVSDLVEEGMERQAAILKAVEEFGDAAVLAKNLQSVSLNNRKRWMMRFMTLATAGLFMVAVLTMAMWPEKARFGSPSQSVAQQQTETGDNPFGSSESSAEPLPPKPKPGNIEPSKRTQAKLSIRKALDQPVDLVYDSVPFGDVCEQLTRDWGFNIVIDGNLDGMLDGDTEVSANLVGLPLSQSLRTTLKAVDATYAIKDGVLLIISIDDEQEPDYLSRHMFDVREVLELIKETESDRVGKPVATRTRGTGGGVFRIAPQMAGGGLGGPQQEDDAVPQLLTAESLLVDTITRVVNSDAWELNGTGNCDLACIGGVLVVVSHESLSEEVGDFLTDLTFQMKNQD